jgi:hypothetical protein
MDVEVFDFDGPFSEAESLGHAEINFLKQSPGQLADFWLPLNGKTARVNGSKLHLRVFLTHTRDADALPEYLERVGREAGLKVFPTTILTRSVVNFFHKIWHCRSFVFHRLGLFTLYLAKKSLFLST